MLGLKQLLFGNAALAELPEDIRRELANWRKTPSPALGELHFHVRYVVIDIASSGFDPETDRLLGIAASSVERGAIRAGDAFYAEFSPAAAVDLQLMALLRFLAKAPLVTYHVPYVGGFLRRAFRERLGVDFRPQWVDLAWLLPSLYADKCDKVAALDHWVETLGLDAGGRRDAMANTLLLGKIFQMLLVRAAGKQVDTAARLIEESRASRELLGSH